MVILQPQHVEDFTDGDWLAFVNKIDTPLYIELGTTKWFHIDNLEHVKGETYKGDLTTIKAPLDDCMAMCWSPEDSNNLYAVCVDWLDNLDMDFEGTKELWVYQSGYLSRIGIVNIDRVAFTFGESGYQINRQLVIDAWFGYYVNEVSEQ